MFAFVLKSAAMGIIATFALLCLFPSLSNGKFSLANIMHRLEAPASYHEAVSAAAPAVVNVYTKSAGADGKLVAGTLGSGVIMESNGFILTNYHVIEDSKVIVVALQDSRIFNASVVGVDKLTDLAVLKIDPENHELPVIPQNSKRVSRVGDVVFAIGNPFNVGQTVTQGIISAKGRSGLGTMGPNSDGRQDLLQTDANIGVGNSGGALINSAGELVGINTGAYYAPDGKGGMVNSNIAFAVPYRLCIRIMNAILKDGRVIRGYLGIDTDDLDVVTADLLNLQLGGGLVITSIDPNGPAGKYGMQVGDIMVAIDDKKITSEAMAMDVIAETVPGKTIDIEVLRHGERITIPVEVVEDVAHY